MKNRFWNPVLYCNVLYCTVQVLEPAVRGPAHLHRAGAQVGAGAGAAAARLRVRHQGVGGPPRRPGQVSCDWWRAGHVTTCSPLIGLGSPSSWRWCSSPSTAVSPSPRSGSTCPSHISTTILSSRQSSRRSSRNTTTTTGLTYLDGHLSGTRRAGKNI